jgi:RHS repeat-associated protein
VYRILAIARGSGALRHDQRLTGLVVPLFPKPRNMTTGPAVPTQLPTTCNYDARNRLTVSSGVAYSYNPDGRRTALTDYTTNSNGIATNFAVDPNGKLDRVLIRNVAGVQTFYVYGLGLIGQEENGVYAQYHFDSRGSTVALTNSAGAVTDQFAYGPYGELLSHSGNSDTPFEFNGQYGVQTDPNGLLYMRARFYNPLIRRFINQDVLFGDIDPGISLNRFAFANGNPISLMDPFGLCAESDDPGIKAKNLFRGWYETIAGGIAAFQVTVLSFESPDMVQSLPILAKALGGVEEAAVAGEEAAVAAETTVPETGAISVAEGGGNIVYRSVDAAGNVNYVGITGNLERRAAEQLAQKGIEIRAIPGLQNLSRADARAVEQVLIETHGLGKNGGTLLNKINSISPNNPAYVDSLKRGVELLKRMGYPGF